VPNTRALVFPTDNVVPKLILPRLLPTHFEIMTEPAPDATAAAEE
jgi:hypothetical protein